MGAIGADGLKASCRPSEKLLPAEQEVARPGAAAAVQADEVDDAFATPRPDRLAAADGGIARQRPLPRPSADQLLEALGRSRAVQAMLPAGSLELALVENPDELLDDPLPPWDRQFDLGRSAVPTLCLCLGYPVGPIALSMPLTSDFLTVFVLQGGSLCCQRTVMRRKDGGTMR